MKFCIKIICWRNSEASVEFGTNNINQIIPESMINFFYINPSFRRSMFCGKNCVPFWLELFCNIVEPNNLQKKENNSHQANCLLINF